MRLAELPTRTGHAEAEPAEVESGVALYDVLLLAGAPREHTCMLPSHLSAGQDIEVAGERWTVADVRPVEGQATRLICIYAV